MRTFALILLLLIANALSAQVEGNDPPEASLTIDSTGLLRVTIVNARHAHYLVQEAANDSWVTVNSITAQKGDTLKFEVQMPPDHSQRQYRVSPGGGNRFPRKSYTVSHDYGSAEVGIKVRRNYIRFTRATEYLLYNERSEVVMKGEADRISLEGLPRGNYTIYYDNKIRNFKR